MSLDPMTGVKMDRPFTIIGKGEILVMSRSMPPLAEPGVFGHVMLAFAVETPESPSAGFGQPSGME